MKKFLLLTAVVAFLGTSFASFAQQAPAQDSCKSKKECKDKKECTKECTKECKKDCKHKTEKAEKMK